MSILVLTACICGCLSSDFFGFFVSSYFFAFLLGFARVNSMGVISLSSSESTGVMFAWNTNIGLLIVRIVDHLLVRRWFFLTVCMSLKYRGSLT